MKNDQAEVNSKGHLIIPKEIRHQFHLVPGSTVKIEIEGERIILIPQALVSAMEKIIIGTLKKTGLKPDAASLEHYRSAMKLAFDNISSEVEDDMPEVTEQPSKVSKVSKSQSIKA